MDDKLKIFIASSKNLVDEAKKLADNINKNPDISARVWNELGVFAPSQYIFDEVLRASQEYDAGIFILDTNELYIKKSGENNSKPIHKICENVLLEAGVFAGIKSKENVCLYTIDDIDVPSDWKGINIVKAKENPLVYDEINVWLNNVREHYRKKGSGSNIWANRHGLENTPPTFISSKKIVESKLPLEIREHGAKAIRLVNYAGTSFLAGGYVAVQYPDEWKEWFERTLKGGTAIDIIITKQRSFAARDAAMYKMYPTKGQKIEPQKIIKKNYIALKQTKKKIDCLKKKNPNIHLNAYETKIALPYALLETIFKDENKNHIKVDLYSPYTNNDDNRPSFMVYKSENPELYAHFENVINAVICNSKIIRRSSF